MLSVESRSVASTSMSCISGGLKNLLFPSPWGMVYSAAEKVGVSHWLEITSTSAAALVTYILRVAQARLKGLAVQLN